MPTAPDPNTVQQAANRRWLPPPTMPAGSTRSVRLWTTTPGGCGPPATTTDSFASASAAPAPWRPRKAGGTLNGGITREGVLAVTLAVSAAVLGWQWWPEGGQALPSGAPFPIAPNDTSVTPMESFADVAMEAVPPVPVPLPEPMELEATFGLAASAFPEPIPDSPPSPHRAIRVRSIHALQAAPRLCRRMTARASLDGPLTAVEMDRLREACRPGRGS